MRILVFGAGAIGCFLGHQLVLAGHNVTLVGRPALVTAVQKHGLCLRSRDSGTLRHSPALATPPNPSPSRDLPAPDCSVVWPQAATDIAELALPEREWDLVLLTVKVYDTDEACQTLAPYLPKGTPVLLVQNGVGGEDLARLALPETPLNSGVLTMSVSVEGVGQIRQETSSGSLNIAPVGRGQLPAAVQDLVARSGLRVVVYDDYRAMKWSKLLLNLLANAVPAILDMSPREVYASAPVFTLERRAFVEALGVMRALDLKVVNFPGYPVTLLARAMQSLPDPLLRPLMTRLVASGRGDKKPSLQLDLTRGKQQSEVSYLNGAVVEQGARLKVKTPVNQAIVETLLGLVEGRLSWDEYRCRPDRLLSAVRSQ